RAPALSYLLGRIAGLIRIAILSAQDDDDHDDHDDHGHRRPAKAERQTDRRAGFPLLPALVPCLLRFLSAWSGVRLVAFVSVEVLVVGMVRGHLDDGAALRALDRLPRRAPRRFQHGVTGGTP